MHENKFYGILGLAKKAGKVLCGSEPVVSGIRNRKIRIVIISKNASERTKKTIEDKCKSYGIKYIFVNKSEDLCRAVGKDNCVAAAVTDKNFANELEQIYKNMTEVAENGSC
ncbi:MAG: ribosomal L7Ae/L30e/S12e/Gadd45 family protein [Clostridia bacterium]|nr:ribosomal L7Ae/L30e/S12e/Gadd45 family protein [Clostridia bacterium]